MMRQIIFSFVPLARIDLNMNGTKPMNRSKYKLLTGSGGLGMRNQAVWGTQIVVGMYSKWR